MSKDISTAVNYLRENISETDITLYAGAREELIAQFEEVTKIRLPDDIKEFYRFSNGFESEDDMFRIIPLDEIVEHKDYSLRVFTIAEYLSFCDSWEIEINLSNVNSYLLSEGSFGTVLTNSFSDFLFKFFEGGVFKKGGLYDWHEEMKLNKI
jgi:SMI1 / KNR4 family (SUKH-1)